MPIGIGTYGIYMRLSVAAPELAGRWGIAEFPGRRREDGTVDRSIGGIAQQADMILAQTEHPEESWQFLKWWTSADVQERFGKELESLIGSEARWNTANLEAFRRLPWKKDDLEVITAGWKWARDMPVVLGGYFTGRHIVNAWNRVVMSKESRIVNDKKKVYVSPRDSLETAVKDINRELRQKQEEYGVGGEIQ
jgi:ABC-type glycerol-3-phosphate transport system substrate-binding protein